MEQDDGRDFDDDDEEFDDGVSEETVEEMSVDQE